MVGFGFLLGNYRERSLQQGRNLEEYDFLPFDVNQDKHPYFESEKHDLFLDALLRTDMKLDENILSKEEHENSMTGNERLFYPISAVRPLTESGRSFCALTATDSKENLASLSS